MTVPEVLTRYSRPVAVGAVLILALIAIAGRGDRTSAVEHAVSTAVSATANPVQRSLNAIARGAAGLASSESDEKTVRMENAMFRQRLVELGAVAIRARELESENKRLKRLLGFLESVEFETVPARVIGRDYSYLTIDRGSDSSIREHMCVLTSEGVVGRVLNVSGHTSKVLLIWDSNSRLGGIVQRTRVQGIIEGDQDGRCIMKYIEASVDVKPDDVVVTSGQGGVFPKGLAVGKVVSVSRREGELFQTATVELSADIGRLEEVLVAVAERGAAAAVEPVITSAEVESN